MAEQPDSQRVTLVVRRREPCPAPERAPEGPMSREEFAHRHAAHADDLAAAADYARRHRLEVVDSSPVARTLTVEGGNRALESAFAPPPGRPEGTPPAELEGVVTAVLGLGHHPLARPHLPAGDDAGAGGGGGDGGSGSRFTCPEIARLYSFPEADGAGQTIAVICLGGGFHQSDLDAFAASIDLPSPSIEPVGVEGGSNQPASQAELDRLVRYLETAEGPPPSDRAMYTLETTMDVELAFGFAPGARVVAYFAPANDEQGFYRAVSAAAFDEQRKPSVISLSWGWKEEQWQDESAAILPVVEDLLAEAGRLGITFCCSSGDSGAGGGAGASGGEQVWVQYPASSPYALSCGGTMIEVRDGEIVSETAWRQEISGQVYSSGGGVSVLFDRPSWQDGIELLDRDGKRGVPDVAALADRGTGVAMTIGGSEITGGGTSAVAPMWSGLTARLDQALGSPIGHANPRLYAAAKRQPACFQDVTAGGNQEYQASAGWDAVTGLGSPHGERLQAALAADGAG